jgi:potassium uptake TrkH family protein
VVAFGAAILVGASLLMLPFATEAPGSTSFLTAAFTSTSAICVTGLIVVDTPVYWTHFGQVVILALIQIGGFGIMTLASLLAILLVRRLGLRGRLLAQAETGTLGLGDVRRVVRGVLVFSLLFEAAAAFVLALRLLITYDYSAGSAVYHGVFTSVSAFNNAGFSLWSDSVVQFATDGWISVTIALAIIAGGIGFPVWMELRRELNRPRLWSLHTKLTLTVTALLIFLGFVLVLAFEWNNPQTLGQLDTAGKLLASFFQGVVPRTAGFNSLDYGEMKEETLLVTDAFMYIGAGSASTAGGIKVTTLAVLALMVWAEIRSEPELNAFGRRIPAHAQRQALAVALIGFGALALCTLVLVSVSPFSLSQSVFEAASAFGTVGLSTGITGKLPEAGQIALIVLMYLGRTGPLTLATALALRERERRIRYAEARPIIG